MPDDTQAPSLDPGLGSPAGADFTPQLPSAKRSLLGLIPLVGPYLLNQGYAKAHQEHNDAVLMLDSAMKDFFPAVQKFAQGDPSITQKQYELSIGQISSALKAFGPVGKTRAMALDHAVQLSREKKSPGPPPPSNGSVPGMGQGGSMGEPQQMPAPPTPSPSGPFVPPEGSGLSTGASPFSPSNPITPPQPMGSSVPESGLPSVPQQNPFAPATPSQPMTEAGGLRPTQYGLGFSGEQGKIGAYEAGIPIQKAEAQRVFNLIQQYIAGGYTPEQAADAALGRPVQFAPGYVTKPGEEVISAAGKRLGTNLQPRLEKLEPGTNLASVGVTPQGGLPPAPGSAPVGAPGSGGASIIASGGPPLPDKSTIEALTHYAATHGLKSWQDVPGTDWAKAKSEFGEASMTKTQRDIADAKILSAQELSNMRKLESAKFGQQLREWNLTKSPEALGKLADQVHDNPDLFQKLSGPEAVMVANTLKDKYNEGAPRPLDAKMKAQENAALLAYNHVQSLRPFLDNPTIQKRLGAWNGRVGELEQLIGTTAKLSPEDSRAIQEFRTRLPYLFGQEGSAIMGRPAQKFMDELKKVSPRTTMGVPLLQGAMDAIQNNARVTIDSAAQAKKGIQALPPPPGSRNAAGQTQGTVGSSGKYSKIARSGTHEIGLDKARNIWVDTTTGQPVE